MNQHSWESKFSNWTQPSSNDESTKCENAETVIRKALKASSALNVRDIRVAAHGSYRNNTNVRQNSDVDIYACCYDTCYSDFTHADNFNRDDVGLTDATYLYSQYKDEVRQALFSRFGVDGVTEGNKAFDIHANTYRVDADVMACFEYRLYTNRNRSGGYDYISGIKAFSSKGEEVINWPEQNYTNGVAKNTSTNYFYKRVVRIVKRLRYEMSDLNIDAASAIPSYLVECMVHNVPNEGFRQPTYVDDVRYVLAHLYDSIQPNGNCQEWAEINGMKYLFHYSQPWTRSQAFAFVSAAWEYIGFQ